MDPVAISSAFGKSLSNTLVDKYSALATSTNIPADRLAEYWDAYSLSNDDCAHSDATLTLFAAYVRNALAKAAPAANNNKRKVLVDTNGTTPAKAIKQDPSR